MMVEEFEIVVKFKVDELVKEVLFIDGEEFIVVVDVDGLVEFVKLVEVKVDLVVVDDLEKYIVVWEEFY